MGLGISLPADVIEIVLVVGILALLVTLVVLVHQRVKDSRPEDVQESHAGGLVDNRLVITVARHELDHTLIKSISFTALDGLDAMALDKGLVRRRVTPPPIGGGLDLLGGRAGG